MIMQFVSLSGGLDLDELEAESDSSVAISDASPVVTRVSLDVGDADPQVVTDWMASRGWTHEPDGQGCPLVVRGDDGIAYRVSVSGGQISVEPYEAP